MKKNRKTLGILLCAAISAVALFGAACEKDESAHEHAYGAWETTAAATCAKEGERERVCSCGDKQVEKIAKTEHANVVTVGEQASTCAVKGHSSCKKCEDCGVHITEPTELPLAAHTPVDVAAKAPSCFEAGNTAGKKCSVCGAMLEGEEVPATGEHVWNGGVQTKAPEYQVKGETTYTCTTEGCGATRTEEIPALTYQPSDIWDGSVATAFAGGDGSTSAPYLISNAKELAYLAQQVNGGETYKDKIFLLTKDIMLNDISDYENWNSNTKGLNTWTSIGLNSAHPFAGQFSGNGHAVRGMYGVSTGAGLKCIGLFGHVDANFGWVQFRKVAITEAYVYAKTTVGGLAAVLYSGASVEETEFSGKLYGYTAGGIFGEMKSVRRDKNVDISNSKTSGSIECIEDAVNGSVNNGYVGGVIGKLMYRYSSIELYCVENSCYVKGMIAGGIVGATYPDDSKSDSTYVQNVKMTNCKNRGRIEDMAKVDNCVIGGIIGEAKFRGGRDNNDACIQLVNFYDNYNYGAVKAVSKESSAGGVAGKVWIYGKYTTSSSDTWHANFWSLQNLGEISAKYLAGGIFAAINVPVQSTGVEMSSCLNEGKVSVDLTNKSGVAGGIVGYSAHFKYEICYNAGEISAYGRAGGIIGSADGIVRCENSFNKGKVSSNTYAGGLVGYGATLKLDCVYNSGTIGVASTKERNAKFGAIYGNGSSSSETTCCYYLDGTVSSSGGYNGNKLSEEKMKDLRYFEGFNSRYTRWKIDSDSEYKYPVFINLEAERDE